MRDFPEDKKIYGEELEIYVHVPFCVKKCAYCDFFSGPFGEDLEARYFEDLLREIRKTPEPMHEKPVQSVFFGGGTPSAVKAERIADVLTLLRKVFRIREDSEITLEANPGTLTPEKLAVYKEAGVNRLSMGLQSADKEILKALGRIHTFEDAEESVRIAREQGFKNIGLDLISAVPGLTKEKWLETLEKAVSLGPEHISAYSLILEPGTPFYALYGPGTAGEKELPSEDLDREMVHLTKSFLESRGYRQYEISNFARPGFESVHNTGYWTGVPYLGFGAAAASYTGRYRYKNAASLDYLSREYEETESLTKTDRMNEFVMLGLRMNDGISLSRFEELFEEDLTIVKMAELRRLLGYGAVMFTGDRLCLTEYGMDVSNAVFRNLMF